MNNYTNNTKINMSNSLIFKDYMITSQLMEESESFYLRFYNVLLNKKYENTVHYKTLDLPGKCYELFTLLNNCLDNKEGYTFNFELNNTHLGIVFDAKIGVVLSLSFSIMLEETFVSDDIMNNEMETVKLSENTIPLKEIPIDETLDSEYQDEVFEDLNEWDKRLLNMSESSRKGIRNSRRIALNDYRSAEGRNEELFEQGNVFASKEYIFENQKQDAENICNIFFTSEKRVVSLIKRTKVGMDGLMIELATKMATHPHDGFALHREKIFFITGMSNIAWETDMKEKVPACFKENVFHHGKLKRLTPKLKTIENALIIIDEIDTGDKEDQKLHKILHESGILDIEYIVTHNIRLVLVSATMKKELVELTKWGDIHETYRMKIPANYIGHGELMRKGIILEYYTIKNDERADKWIQEDIIQHYGSDFRIHIIRTTEMHVHNIRTACERNNIGFSNHTSTDRISHEVLTNIFDNITNHFVIAIKGFYRRANLIPNSWKMKIGATHELCGADYDTSVQIQGLPGRMCGYWRNELEAGHKTGPHRTSTRAIYEYEEWYENPYAITRYHTNSTVSFLHPKYIANVKYTGEPVGYPNARVPIIVNLDGVSSDNDIFTIFPPREEKEKLITREEKEKLITRKKKEELINNFLHGNHKYLELYNFINKEGIKAGQITCPTTDKSYERHIINAVKKAEMNEPFSIDITVNNKNKSHWQCFIDNRKYRMCFILWVIPESVVSHK